MEKPSGIKIGQVYEYSGALDKVEYRNAQGTLTTDDFQYDDYQRKIGATGRYGSQHSYSYSDRGQLKTESTTIGGQTYPVNYLYDSRGTIEQV